VERHDLVIAGIGNASGGKYNLVKIAGNGSLNGDIDCIDLIIQGNAKIHGNVKAKVTHVSGTASMQGSLRSEIMKIQGNASIDGNVECKEVRFQGSGKVKGNLSGDEVYVHGGSKITGDCTAEIFEVKGSFNIGGLLNAGKILVTMFGSCQAKEIGGENIEVKKQKMNLLKKLLFDFNIGLNADSIEGDVIYLEHTKAKVVRGNQVTLGPGCEIDLVEYKNSFQCDKGSKIGSYQQL
jgi:cytoskeletal protein CcmA (bactofilin family)